MHEWLHPVGGALEVLAIIVTGAASMVILVWRLGAWFTSVSEQLRHISSTADSGFRSNDTSHAHILASMQHADAMLEQSIRRLEVVIAQHGERLVRLEAILKTNGRTD